MSVVLAAASSHSLSIADASSLKPTADFTMMAWVNGATTATAQGIFQTYSAPLAGKGLQMSIDTSDHVSCFVGTNNAGTQFGFAGTTDVVDGSWYHIAFTRVTNDWSIYVSGVQDATTNNANSPVYDATNYVRVGCKNTSGSDSAFFDGSLAEIRVWSGVGLSADQIKNEMRSEQPSYLANLSLWLPLDNSVLPATYPDFSQSGNTATPQNTPTTGQSAPF